MEVPKNILKYCAELEKKVSDPDATLTQSDLSKLAEIQSWYIDFLDSEQFGTYPNNLTDEMVDDIVKRMYA